jgi:uncharacterized protein
MLYVVLCLDKPNSEDLRITTRDAHIAFLKILGDQIKFGGPMLDDAGSGMIGSMIVIEASSLDDAKAAMADDPYAQAGLFASVDIRPWKWTVGNPDA